MAKANKETEQILGVVTHALGFFTSFIGPLIVLLATEEEKVKKHARAALNWQISLLIYTIVSIILMIVIIGFLLIAILFVLNVVFVVIAVIRATEGKVWEYPLAIPFMKV